MSHLPALDATRLEHFLGGLGFRIARQKGSHALYRHPDGRVTTVPRHAGQDLSRPFLRGVLREIGLKPEQFSRMLHA